ncbi:MAG: ankyrin repeat domain-containing protein [Thermodesulfobacteriota bacterium]
MKTERSCFGGLFVVVVLTGTIWAAMGPSFAEEPKVSDKTNALINAAFMADEEEIKQLLDKGVDVNLKMSDGYTALLEACTHPRPATPKAVKLLLERGAEVNVVSETGMTPLAGAVFTRSDVETVNLLLEHGADFNATIRLKVSGKPTRELTALGIAAQLGNVPLVRLLVQKGADVNHRDSHGQTPLMAAAWQGRLDAVKILVDKGAQVNVKDNLGQSPLALANHGGHKQVSEFLVQRGAKE